MLKLSELESFLVKIIKLDNLVKNEKFVMSKISCLKSRQVFDSRGFPTIETDVF